jgi:hypothetical protein
MDDSCRDAPALMTADPRPRSLGTRVATAVKVTERVHEFAAVPPRGSSDGLAPALPLLTGSWTG